jgi:hypothetical protein
MKQTAIQNKLLQQDDIHDTLTNHVFDANLLLHAEWRILSWKNLLVQLFCGKFLSKRVYFDLCSVLYGP